jgi:alpha-mannosidase
MHPHPRFMEAVAEFRRHLPAGYEVSVGSLVDYLAAIRRARAGQLKVQVRGELRTPRHRGDAAELMNVLSVRPALKAASRRAEQSLIFGADLWAALAAAQGMKYPRDLLDRAWRLFLVNQCHDTSGGVGVDRVHEDQAGRFRLIGDLVTKVLRESLAYLARRTGFRPATRAESNLVVFNPLAGPRSSVIECSLDVPAADDAGSISLRDAAGRAVPCEVISARRLDTKVYTPYDRYGMQEVRRFRMRLLCPDLPACGYAAYTVAPAAEPPPAPAADLRWGADWMENGHLRAKFHADGTWDLRSREAGRTFRNCGWYEDTGNVWDGWGYCAPAHDVRVTSPGRRARVRRTAVSALSATFTVESLLRVPVAANEARDGRAKKLAAIPIRSEITLYSGDPVLHVRTTVDNRARDHRLRVMFPTIPGAQHSWAETPYDVVRRNIKVPDSAGWEEPWQGTQPMLGFADVSNGRTGLAVIPRGLCEYEVLEDRQRTLAVTLLRAYTHWHPRGRRTLSPEIVGSQAPGEQVFEYGLYPHRGNWERGEVARLAHETLIPPVPVQQFGNGASGPRNRSYFTIGSDKLVLHAVKQAEQGGGLLVRLGNPTARTVRAWLGCTLPVHRAALCNMAEEEQTALPVDGSGRVRLELGPKKIATVTVQTEAEPD